MKLDQKKVKELFDYRNGKLIWRERPLKDFKDAHRCNAWNSRFSGKEAGSVNINGYRYIKISFHQKPKIYKAHRLIWFWHYGEWPKDQLDHIDHNKSNNRIENLREATGAQNQKNQSKNKNNTSGFTGVYWHIERQKWRSHITENKKQKHLGYFEHLAEAVAARKEAEIKYGFHPNHGSVKE